MEIIIEWHNIKLFFPKIGKLKNIYIMLLCHEDTKGSSELLGHKLYRYRNS